MSSWLWLLLIALFPHVSHGKTSLALLTKFNRSFKWNQFEGETPRRSLLFDAFVGHGGKDNAQTTEVDRASQCDLNKLKQCAIKEADTLGITAKSFNAVILQLGIIDSTKSGLLKLCRSLKNFKHCIGESSFPGCTTKETFEQVPFTKDYAFVADLMVFDLNYICAHKVFVENWDCIQLTAVEKFIQFLTCGAAFKKVRDSHPAQAILCKALSDLETCGSTPYEKPCGKEVGLAMCFKEDANAKRAFPETTACDCSCASD